MSCRFRGAAARHGRKPFSGFRVVCIIASCESQKRVQVYVTFSTQWDVPREASLGWTIKTTADEGTHHLNGRSSVFSTLNELPSSRLIYRSLVLVLLLLHFWRDLFQGRLTHGQQLGGENPSRQTKSSFNKVNPYFRVNIAEIQRDKGCDCFQPIFLHCFFVHFCNNVTWLLKG